MILYCGNPRAATDAFGAAIGLGSDGAPSNRPFGPTDLIRFREIVACELDAPGDSSVDPTRVWIAKLPGSGPAT